MFDIQKYLDSGIIEDCCLGIASNAEVLKLEELCLQFEEIATYKKTTEASLNMVVKAKSKIPPSGAKERIKAFILENEKVKKLPQIKEGELLEEFIHLSNHTDVEELNHIVSNIQPPAQYENIHMVPIFTSEDRELTLVWAKEMVPDELHPEIDESFYILDGTVECEIEGEIHFMGKGEYMRIPPEKHHEVRVTSLYPAKAIMSRIKIA